MADHSPFAPYRIEAGALAEEAARVAAVQAAGPLVAPAGDPLPAGLLTSALAELPAGRAAGEPEACRAADGSPAGLGGPPRACLTSARHQARVAEAAKAALVAGYAGVALDAPDASLAQGLLGAGFCADCQREFARRLSREYGDQFQPIDFLQLAREALASASGAVGHAALPFGREFWRFRNDALERAVRAQARAARDAARAAGRPFSVAARFEALGPAQLQAARLLDGAIFPVAQPPEAASGLVALLRAVMGRRPAALAVPDGTPAAARLQLAALGACAGVGLSGLLSAGGDGAALARVRALMAAVASEGRAPGMATPVAEAALLYSAEADLWSGGRHRRAVEAAGAALRAIHLQAPVVLRVADAPAGALLVLAGAAGLTTHESREATRRLEAGGHLLCIGAASRVDETGRDQGAFLPAAKVTGTRSGLGLLAQVELAASGEPTVDGAELERALAALVGRRRAVGATGRARLSAWLWRHPGGLDLHLATLGGERAQGSMLFLGQHLAGGSRRARFRSADGSDVEIRLNPSSQAVSTVLPAFHGYAVVGLET